MPVREKVWIFWTFAEAIIGRMETRSLAFDEYF